MAKKKNINNVNNDVSPIMMISIFIIFIIAMVFVTFFGMNLSSPINKYFSSYNTKITNNLNEVIKKQQEMDNKIKELSASGNFEFDDPCVIKNPYEINPLTAIIIFNTENDTRVEVSINDQLVTTVERSKAHIIPIYGLLDNTKNYVKLTLEDGRTNEVVINVEPLDHNIYDFDVSTQIGTNDIYYMLGNVNDYNSNLRGFDRLNNLISYVSLDYIGGFTLYKNKIAIAYNQNKDVAHDLRLDIDFLGRISNITSNTNEINYETNISGEDVGFIGGSYNIYSDLIGNYTFNPLVSNDSKDTYKELSLDEYENRLQKANKYPGDFKVSYMEKFIAYTIDQPGELLVVTYDGKLLSYDIDNKGIIKIEEAGNKSLYVNIDGNIYSLRTTLID